MVFAVHDFDYLDLDLSIERSCSDYQVRVLSSLAGHRRCRFMFHSWLAD
jgi:hypothetical protein